MKETFGSFVEESLEKTEYLSIGFSPSSIPLKRRWRNNGLSADFIADYLQTFSTCAPEDVSEIKNAVKYVANELLENAMKFSEESLHYPTKITFLLYEDKVIFHVINTVSNNGLSTFQAFIEKFTKEEDLNDFYLRQIEANAEDEKSNHSGLGFLSMACDYGAKIGWKFETIFENHPIILVTTSVSLNL
jgi:hypothetical protein